MEEKRRYVRMSTVFPVEIQLHDATGEKLLKTLLQGFTRDVGEGGMCVELKIFGKKIEDLLGSPNIKVSLYINPIFSRKPIQAFGRLAWCSKESSSSASAFYRIGVQYIQIEEKNRRRIIGYAKKMIWLPRLATAGVLMLAGLLVSYALYNQRLVDENKRLVNQLVRNAELRSQGYEEVAQLQGKRVKLEKELTRMQELAAQNEENEKKYRAEIARAESDRQGALAELTALKKNRELLEKKAESAGEKAAPPPALMKQMVEWLKTHRHLKTGLVASFEGDEKLKDWGFTYDESLACQVFLLFNETRLAQDILKFYAQLAVRQEGVFFNAYHVSDGTPAESEVTTGPNVWIGLAALQYEVKVKDGQFLPLARQIGDWILKMQDFEGGVRGGPQDTWYSTEHNLDVYAFLKLLGRITQDARYTEAAGRSLAWIKKYAYSNAEKRMNRGKGDSTISTDTFSWAIAALGPATLKEIQFDVDGIMEFAENNCAVSVQMSKPDGRTLSVKGFDFAKSQNLGRGGVISVEWTAQMIVTYQILADYYRADNQNDKASLYSDKSALYLNELQKMIITSPSPTGQGRGCLPYASAGNVDTGHGWRTPNGDNTGSVAATAYGIFAWLGYNPFDI